MNFLTTCSSVWLSQCRWNDTAQESSVSEVTRQMSVGWNPEKEKGGPEHPQDRIMDLWEKTAEQLHEIRQGC